MSQLEVKNLSLEEGMRNNPKLAKYATELSKLDKDGNGQLDLDEICEAIDSMVESERQNRLLKRLAILLGVISLLTIAATVGLTAAVVVLSKDTKSKDGALVDKDTNAALATGQYFQTSSISDLLSSTDRSPAFLTRLSGVKSLVTTAPDGTHTLHTVVAYSMHPDTSLTFTSAAGQDITYWLNDQGQMLTKITCTEDATDALAASYTEVSPEGTTTGRKLTGKSSGKGAVASPPPPAVPVKTTSGGDGVVSCMACSNTCMSGCAILCY